MLLIVDNYDSFTYNLVHLAGALGETPRVVRNDDASAREIVELTPSAIIVSPGPCTPDDAGVCVNLAAEARGRIPLLGVCLGHQSAAQASGAKIIRCAPMHGKIAAVRHLGHPLFDEIPQRFNATRYHSLAVERETLPASFDIIAESDEDDVIMGIADDDAKTYGVQFHPESVATEHGATLLRNFLRLAGMRRG